jgi:hypothetical protein
MGWFGNVMGGLGGAFGGAGIAEGIMDWRRVFTGGDAPAPSTGPVTAQLHQRAADLPGGQAMDALGFRHQWLEVNGRQVGMGPDDGSVPGRNFDIPGVTQTTLNDHTGEEPTASVPLRGVDPTALDERLQQGSSTGAWFPFLNDCNQAMNDALRDSGANPRDIPSLSPLHSRGLHDVIRGHEQESYDTEMTMGLMGAGGVAGALNPALGLGLAGAGAASYLSGTMASRLEDQGRTTEAEAVSILGMGASGASIGGSVAGIPGALVGGGIGLAAGGVASLLGDESADSARVNIPGTSRSISAEEGVGIAGMAGGGALIGTAICPGIGTAVGAGVGALGGLVMSLFD